MFIIKFRYKFRRNKRWSIWYTWHGKEGYETLDEAKAQLWQAYIYHRKDNELNTIASKIAYEIQRIETTIIEQTEIDL